MIVLSVRYDIITGVEIGWGAGAGMHTDIAAIVSFGDRLISRDDGHVFPLNIINTVVPQGVHHNQKHYEMEFILDSFNYDAFYNQRVQAGDVNSRAIRQGVANDDIEYFAVFIRESDGTETRYSYECEQVYVVGQVHDYTNEQGNRHKPTTINMVCLGSRTDSADSFVGVPTGDLSHIRTDLVTTPTGTATNILSVREEYIMQNNIRFVPNVYEGVAMKYDHEWRELVLTFDSDVDIFDAYIDDDGPNPVIPTLIIDHTMVNPQTQVEETERWSYHANSIYVRDRMPGDIVEGRERNTFEYHILAYNTKTVSTP